MILKNVKVEHTDKRTGLVLKKIITSEWEHLNRKIDIMIKKDTNLMRLI